MSDDMRYLLEAVEARSLAHPLVGLSGVIRLDVRDGDSTEHYFLTVSKGTVTVGGADREPDCVLTGDAATFQAIMGGEANAMAAVLRGAVDVQGKVILMTAVQRLFPGSPGAPGDAQAGYAGRPS